MAWSRTVPTATLALILILVTLAACSGQTPSPRASSNSSTIGPSPESPAAPTSTVEPTKPPTLPTAIPTAPPTPSPIPHTPSPSFEDRFRADLAQTAFDYTTRLAQELGPRASATQQEKAAADFLVGELTAMGYQTELQPFSFETLSREDSFFTLDPAPPGLAGDGGTLINLLSRTGAGEASGILTSVGLAMSGDIPVQGLEGQIALIERGAISFRQKVDRAAEAGALAAVIYNSEPGNFRGTLGRRGSGSTSIPVVSISGEDGAILLEALSQGEITATVSVVRKELFSWNVVAEKPGPGDAIVVLGGHYDSVPDVPAANDNASGTAVLLTVAKSLADRELPFTVMFVPFGSEELGLLGSQAYLDSLSDEEIARIGAMLNFDALGTGSEVRILGNSRLTTLGIDLGNSLDISLTRSAGLIRSTSDHANFDRAGIPVLMFTASDSSRIHTPEDTMEFIQASLLGDSARLALAILESPEFLPDP